MLSEEQARLYNVLDRCGRTPAGQYVNCEDRMIALLVRSELLALHEGGTAAVTTPKGRAVLHQLASLKPRGQILRPVRH